MHARSMALAVGCAVIAGLLSTGSASAATVVGNNCAANTGAPSLTLVSLAGHPGDPLPNAIPSAGVITSWTYDDAAPFTEVVIEQQLKILHPTAIAKQFQVVGESTLSTVSAGSHTFPTRIPVQPGDLIGATGVIHAPTEVVPFVLFCFETQPGDLIGATMGAPTTGSTAEVMIEQEKISLPITVTVEPDADGDGFGDETQDQCPTDASTQGPCPVKAVAPPPPPPLAITLSASAVAKKGLITVTVTASALTDVTVGGSVKLGRGKTAKLGGKAEPATPGTFTKFNLPFPAKLKAALKQTPPSKKLSLDLSVSAPGATKTLTVKVPGQEKAAPHHKSKA
jgi:hypothetical protein